MTRAIQSRASMDSNNNFLGGASTDNNGAYSIKVAAGTTGTVSAAAQGFVPPNPQAFNNIQQNTTINFNLQPAP